MSDKRREHEKLKRLDELTNAQKVVVEVVRDKDILKGTTDKEVEPAHIVVDMIEDAKDEYR